MTTLLIDNYDSFTWNVYQSLVQLGAHVVVHRNDKITLAQVETMAPCSIVISPGPGHPRAAAISNDVIRAFAGRVPILGVCLGQQCMYEIYGGTVAPIGSVVHGKTSAVRHDGRGVFEGVPQDVQVTRYHSLAGDPATLPPQLEISARTADGIVMAVRHRELIVEGVQFHPESVVSQSGRQMFKNFLAYRGGRWSDMPALAMSGGQDGKTETILDRIFARRKVDVEERAAIPGRSLAQIRRYLDMNLAPPVVDFHRRLQTAAGSVAVIAEVKRASPSRDDISLDANAPELAVEYAAGGVAAISVLTEPHWFKGSVEDMRLVRAAIDLLPDRPAVLCKDFIHSEYQLVEARLYGADSVLLILAMLDEAQCRQLLSLSRQLGMEPLVEVATEAEMELAVQIGAKAIGVNNRNLHDFTVDMSRTQRLASTIVNNDNDLLLVALSGIQNRCDVQMYQNAGASAVLVGEALMRSADKSRFICQLAGKIPSVPLVKICGVARAQDATVAVESGADLIGIILVPGSPRQVDESQAAEIIKQVRSKFPSRQMFKVPRGGDFSTAWSLLHRHRQSKHNSPLIVGVFQEQSPAKVQEIADRLGLDLVQFHGTEAPADCLAVLQPVIKAIGVAPNDTVDSVYKTIVSYKSHADFILLDTKASGGSGQAFDWGIAEGISTTHHVPFILAGGLTPTNVNSAISKVMPACVDCSSGTETDVKGQKNPAKIVEFINNSRNI